MSTNQEQFLTSISSFSQAQIHQAGQRYTPGVDPEAPNLRIASLFDALQNVACGSPARSRFREFLNQLCESWDKSRYCSQCSAEIDAILGETVAKLDTIFVRLRNRDISAAKDWTDSIARLNSCFQADVKFWRAEEERLSPPGGKLSHSNEINTARGNGNAIGQCLAIVQEEIEYSESITFKLLSDPHLLISGEWGTGKTHLLCDFTRDQIRRNQASVLILAKNFEDHVIDEICFQISPGEPAQTMFDHLELVASGLEDRAIIIVDGVNEGRRKEWKKTITVLRNIVKNNKNIGFVVSCRTPFEAASITKEDLDCLQNIRHFGFDDQEFDAQEAFFQYYNLPLPQVPLLDKEFSRPLTLKLICQSLKNLTGKKLANGFAGIASGQKGMTYVLESFVNGIGSVIENNFSLPKKSCWHILKGSKQIADRKYSGFAPCMAATLRGYIRPSEANRIIAAQFPSLSISRRASLLEALRTNGLIEEDVVWYKSRSGFKSRIVYRLPYQRFSDHLIARHLLKEYLDVSSSDAIRNSFARNSPLSRVFKFSGRFHHKYAEPGWAQALIAEFPSRAGNHLPPNERELYYVLPRNSQKISAYFDPFIEGLFWRDPAAFTEGTHLIINHLLNTDSRAWETTVDTLVAISTKPQHPYHARRLYNFIAHYPMPDRDLTWSEYLRRKYASPTIHRLLTWCSNINTAELLESLAKELVVLLSLVLTTVVRNDRDLSTKALVLIGESYPEALFSHTVTSLDFNDPYLPERMLAAAYGVTMSLADSESATSFLPVLRSFALTIYAEIFGEGGKHSTNHALMRDYASGIIDIAIRKSCINISDISKSCGSNIYPITSSNFISDIFPDNGIKEEIGYAIQMDFGNYTIGGMIPDRSNYDDKIPEYVEVRAKIERRIFDLGYREDKFKLIDNEIGRLHFRSHDASKVDRYGKKYSWIAYFEMYGEREAAGLLPEWRQGERTPDCGIDPSFPKRPPAWNPPIPDLFGALHDDTAAWVGGGYTPRWDSLLCVPEINGIQGEWVLLEGYINGVDKCHDREIFTFLRGALVARSDVVKLKRQFMSIDYPGNNEIPESHKEYYLFAGEAGRRTNYASHLLQKNGQYRRQVKNAFDRYIMNDGKHQNISGIPIELPAVSFDWESHHSTQNQYSGFYLPAPSIIQRLTLASKMREIDFYDIDMMPATLYRESGGWYQENHHSLLYIRADLLRKYLTKTRQVLVWLNWGERDWFKKMDGHQLLDNHARQRIWQAYRHIHRSFSQWNL